MDNKAFRYIGVAALALAAAVIAYLLVGAIGAGRFVMLTDEQAKAVLASNDYKTEQQRIVAEAAVSLKGGVHYFWGGKSRAIGPDLKRIHPEHGIERQHFSDGLALFGMVPSLKPAVTHRLHVRRQPAIRHGPRLQTIVRHIHPLSDNAVSTSS